MPINSVDQLADFILQSSSTWPTKSLRRTPSYNVAHLGPESNHDLDQLPDEVAEMIPKPHDKDLHNTTPHRKEKKQNEGNQTTCEAWQQN